MFKAFADCKQTVSRPEAAVNIDLATYMLPGQRLEDVSSLTPLCRVLYPFTELVVLLSVLQHYDPLASSFWCLLS